MPRWLRLPKQEIAVRYNFHKFACNAFFRFNLHLGPVSGLEDSLVLAGSGVFGRRAGEGC